MYDTYFMDCNEEPRRWDVTPNLATVIKIQKTLSVDIMTALDVDMKGNLKNNVLEQMRTDPALLVDVLFICCEKQAAERNVSAEDFGSLFVDGAMIENATNALLQGIINIQPPKKKEILTHFLKMTQKYENSMFEKSKLFMTDPATKKMLEAEIEKVFSAPQPSEK